jgi:hypothetical protein
MLRPFGCGTAAIPRACDTPNDAETGNTPRFGRAKSPMSTALDLLGASRRAARQSPELVEVDGSGAFRRQVGVDEGEVGDFILGVVVDVLRHVGVELLHRLGKLRIPAAAWHLAVLDTRKLVVLLPQIGLDNFGRSQEAENVNVSLRWSVVGERR